MPAQMTKIIIQISSHLILVISFIRGQYWPEIWEVATSSLHFSKFNIFASYLLD